MRSYPEVVFEGLFSPSHLVIIAFVLFLVVSPRKMANHWHRINARVQQLGEDQPEDPHTLEAVNSSRSASYRIGRLLRRKRR